MLSVEYQAGLFCFYSGSKALSLRVDDLKAIDFCVVCGKFRAVFGGMLPVRLKKRRDCVPQSPFMLYIERTGALPKIELRGGFCCSIFLTTL